MNYDIHKFLLAVTLEVLLTVTVSFILVFSNSECFGKYKLSTRWHMIGVSGVVSGVVSALCTVLLLSYVEDLYVVRLVGMFISIICSVVTIQVYLIFVKKAIKNNRTTDNLEEEDETNDTRKAE